MSFLKTMINSIARTFGRILAYALIGLAIYFVASHVSASTWVSIYDKSNLNNELAYTGNLSYPVLICTPSNNNLCTRVSSTRGNSISNWNQVGFNIKEELNYNQGDTITFNITFKVIQQGSVLSCSNWGMGAETHLQNRLGISQTINNRNWERITCNHNVTSTGSEEVAVYNYSGSFVATDDGTALSFMFPSNTNYTSNGVMRYGEVNVTLNAQTDNTNEIINNNTQNSQNIINNQNQNTQDIINNQNQNNQDLIDTINNQNRVCSNYFMSNDNVNEPGYLTENGTITQQNNYYHTSDYIPINQNKNYTLRRTTTYGSNLAYCLYDHDRNKLSCVRYGTQSEFTINSSSAYYIRFSANKNSGTITTFEGEYCYDYREKEQETQEEIKSDLQNFLNVFNDISTPSDSEISNSLNGINLPDDTPMTNLLMFPVLLFSFFNNSMSLTCSPVVLGELYGHQLSLPCLNVSQYLGLTLWNIIDLLAMFYMIYNIAHLLIGIFEDISELRSPFLRFFIKNRGALNND